jgi:hypothetical protein
MIHIERFDKPDIILSLNPKRRVIRPRFILLRPPGIMRAELPDHHPQSPCIGLQDMNDPISNDYTTRLTRRSLKHPYRFGIRNFRKAG